MTFDSMPEFNLEDFFKDGCQQHFSESVLQLAFTLIELRADPGLKKSYRFRLYMDVADRNLISRHIFVCLAKISREPSFTGLDCQLLSQIFGLDDEELDRLERALPVSIKNPEFQSDTVFLESYFKDFYPFEGDDSPRAPKIKFLYCLAVSLTRFLPTFEKNPVGLKEFAKEQFPLFFKEESQSLLDRFPRILVQEPTQGPEDRGESSKPPNQEVTRGSLVFQYPRDYEVSRWLAGSIFIIFLSLGILFEKPIPFGGIGGLVALYLFFSFTIQTRVKFSPVHGFEIDQDSNSYQLGYEDVLRIERHPCEQKETLRVVFKDPHLPPLLIHSGFKDYDLLLAELESSRLSERILTADQCVLEQS